MFEEDFTATKASVRESVFQMYLNLPDCFKETPQMVCNVKKDRFGFQAANITATFQLLRIVLFAGSGTSIEQRCQIASEVVEAFVSIPIAYLLSISTPLLHHLGGIGSILGRHGYMNIQIRSYMNMHEYIHIHINIIYEYNMYLRIHIHAYSYNVVGRDWLKFDIISVGDDSY
jgi:hypothetical protein